MVCVRQPSLRSGLTLSCGCLGIEHRRASRQTHGACTSAFYKVWAAMKYRCHNPNDKAYRFYGARGISVCDRWRDDFVTFAADIATEIGERPSKKHSIDRINNNGNYEPGNVRWATQLEQTSNTRRNRWLTLNGETRTVTEWGRHLGVSGKRIDARLRRGASDAEALDMTPRRSDP